MAAARRQELREVLEWIDARIDALERELQALKRLRDHINSSMAGIPEELQDPDSLPWRPFREGEGEWIFEDEAGEELVRKLREGGGRVTIGDYTYILAEGRGRRFIRRKPIQKQSTH